MSAKSDFWSKPMSQNILARKLLGTDLSYESRHRFKKKQSLCYFRKQNKNARSAELAFGTIKHIFSSFNDNDVCQKGHLN